MKEISEIFDIEIDDKELFRKALTHPSYTKEHELDFTECYERLEFLGDAVLKLTISEVLYKNYPDYTEGEMSKIRSVVVSDMTLFEICEKIGLSKHIILAKHEEKQGCRKLESVCACAFEAVLGAYYLDGKLEELVEFIEKTFMPYIKDVDKHFEKFNAKALLQEYTQGQTRETPVYTIIDEKGPAHNKVFEVEVSYHGKVIASGIGKTKKEAEQQAAYNACMKLGIIQCRE